ncbi:MAG: GvpL/GvpF family gas vesicle protein [Bacillota bacterium]
MGEAGLYLYGIVDGRTNVSLGPIGVGEPPADVRLIPMGDMAAVVSPAPNRVIAPRMSYLLAHDRVLNSLIHRYTVLPVAFGTVVPGEGELRACLDRYRSLLATELERLRDKVEVELKAFWVPEALMRAAGYKPGEFQSTEALHPNRRYQLALEVGQVVAATVEAWRQRLAPEICSYLAPCCLGYRLNQPRSVRMLINASFLARRDREPELGRAVRALADRYANRLSFRYVAPLPPYNFVEINLPWRPHQSEG